MRWPYPRILAHRGGGTLAPENTLGAIRLGAQMGFQGVEFDVMLAGDGTPVLMHDETLERTTNGRGRVAQLSHAQIARASTRARASASRASRRPRACAASSACGPTSRSSPRAGYERRTGDAVARMAAEHWRGAPLQPVLSSFSPVALLAARQAEPQLPRGLLVGRTAAALARDAARPGVRRAARELPRAQRAHHGRGAPRGGRACSRGR